MLYLDNAATTWPKPESVYREMEQNYRRFGANPGRGAYRIARETAQRIEETRRNIARFFELDDPKRVIFTAGATDSLNMVLHSLLGKGDHVITSALEHNAVSRPLYALQQQGVQVSIVKHNTDGLVDLRSLQQAFQSQTKAVILCHASNVLGCLQPLEEILQITHQHKAILALDASQSAGTLPLSLQRTPVDLLCTSGHKGLYGPSGIGLLLIGNPELLLPPWRLGGNGVFSESQEAPDAYPHRLESGTLNHAGIYGLGAAIRFLQEQGETIRSKERQLLTRLLEGLLAIPEVTVYGPPRVENRANLVSFHLQGHSPQSVEAFLDVMGIAVRSGLHCAPWAHHWLGTTKQGGTVRVSPGFFNAAEEIEQFLDAIREIVKFAR